DQDADEVERDRARERVRGLEREDDPGERGDEERDRDRIDPEPRHLEAQEPAPRRDVRHRTQHAADEAAELSEGGRRGHRRPAHPAQRRRHTVVHGRKHSGAAAALSTPVRRNALPSLHLRNRSRRVTRLLRPAPCTSSPGGVGCRAGAMATKGKRLMGRDRDPAGGRRPPRFEDVADPDFPRRRITGRKPAGAKVDLEFPRAFDAREPFADRPFRGVEEYRRESWEGMGTAVAWDEVRDSVRSGYERYKAAGFDGSIDLGPEALDRFPIRNVSGSILRGGSMDDR